MRKTNLQAELLFRHRGRNDQGEVVAVGKGKILEDGKVRPLDVKVAIVSCSENTPARR